MVTDVPIDKGQESRGTNEEGSGEEGMILLHTNR